MKAVAFKSGTILIMVLFISWTIAGSIQLPIKNNEWIAPKEADELINPLKGNAEATAAGKKLYKTYCNVCHGDKGKGDGIAGLALKPPPADYSSEKIQKQTDGAIFWKITEGKPPMASYKLILTDAQRWQLVNYTRELGKTGKK